jgi:hypothetical protein
VPADQYHSHHIVLQPVDVHLLMGLEEGGLLMAVGLMQQ